VRPIKGRLLEAGEISRSEYGEPLDYFVRPTKAESSSSVTDHDGQGSAIFCVRSWGFSEASLGNTHYYVQNGLWQ
jgi:hypothetical protein